MIGVVLAGGKSRRMGKDKAVLPYRNTTLLEIAIDKLKSIGLTVAVSCRKDQVAKYSIYGSCIIDQYDDKGPLGGILSCIEQSKEDILVIPTDMPNISEGTIRAMKDAFINQGKVYAFQHENRIYPFPSVIPRSSSLEILNQVNDQNLSCTDFIQSQQYPFVDFPSPSEAINVNRPSDYSALRR